MIEQQITVETADGPMTTFVKHPDGSGPFPIVVVYHDGPGLREDIYDVARRIASNGFYAVLPDLYHRSGKLISFDLADIVAGPGSPGFQRMRATIAALSDEMVLDDTRLALQALKSDPAADSGARGCMGFCMGARAVLRLMAALPDEFVAGSALHPSGCVTDESNSPHLDVRRIRGALYVGFGEADVLSPLAEQQPLRDELARLGVRAQVDVLPGANHGYAFPALPAYQRAAAEVSWLHTVELFRRHLPAPVGV